MPTLTRYLAVLAVIFACVYGVLWSLANLVEPEPRTIMVTVPVQDQLR